MFKKFFWTIFTLTVLVSAITLFFIKNYFYFQMAWVVIQLALNALIYSLLILVAPVLVVALLKLWGPPPIDKNNVKKTTQILVALFLPLWVAMNLYLLPGWKSALPLLCNLLLIFSTFFLFIHFSGIKKVNRFLLIVPFVFITGILGFINIQPGRHQQTTLDSNKNQQNQNDLVSLPYISWSRKKASPDKSGVTLNNSRKTAKGLNFYTNESGHVFLFDMKGNMVHQWQLPSIEGRWEYATLFKNGDILVICHPKCIVKLNKDSKVQWIRYLPAHHDIEIMENGNILVPIFLPNSLYYMNYMDYDAIVTLDAEGRYLDHWSVLEHMEDLKPFHKPRHWVEKVYGIKKIYHASFSIFESLYFSIHGQDIVNISTEKYIKAQINKNHIAKKIQLETIFPFLLKLLQIERKEYHHLNTIKLLPDTPLATEDPRFKPGNWLICLRNTNLILILDQKTKEIVWHYGPDELDRPHLPIMLENGHMLIYDNRFHSTWSRVIEIDPRTKKITWEYKANPPESFFSAIRGSAQRLPNDNTLICDAQSGRAIEVTPDGEIVWEYYNPEVLDEKRRIIYRFNRISDLDSYTFLKDL